MSTLLAVVEKKVDDVRSNGDDGSERGDVVVERDEDVASWGDVLSE